MSGTALLLLYFGAFSVLAFFACHRLWLLWLLRRYPPNAVPSSWPGELPTITVQLPVYNERFVVERLLAAVAQLHYPRDRLEIQVLDDSTDGTSQLVVEISKTLAAQGFDMRYQHRARRAGFKAGALAEGLRSARGEFVLILDADFLPPPDLLLHLLPPLQDERVAMVQARWGHLNRNASRLTRAQALLLDAHFQLETAARARAGLFFSFHGTAGLWRRRAIDDAGGWTADTLTEDLDLSYRAQMRGWRFVFLPDVVVPAELPETLPAFKQQQARWAEGTMAVARKHVQTLLASEWRCGIKIEGLVHLTSHIVYPATLVVALAALPAMLYRRAIQADALLWLDLALALVVIVPTRLFYRRAARAAGYRPPGVRDLPYLLLTGIALSVSNTRAVLRVLLGRPGTFARTPKIGERRSPALPSYTACTPALVRSIEGSVAAYLAVATGIVAAQGMTMALPAFALLTIAFGTTALRG